MKNEISNEALIRAIKKYRTIKAFAEAISTSNNPISYQMVQQWMVGAGVPAKYCPLVERMTGEPRVGLRPKDGHEIWPEHAKAKFGRRKAKNSTT